MLRRTARFLQSHGPLAQQAAACTSLQFNSLLTQTRSRSDAADTPSTDSFSSLDAPSSAAAADGLDLPAGELLSQADSIVSASDAAEAAVFAAIKADCWLGTRMSMDVLSWMHQTMPWFETVALSAVVLKLCTLPLTYLTQKNSPKMAAVKADTERMRALKEQMTQAPSHVEYDRLTREFNKAVAEFQTKHKSTLRVTLGVPVLTLAQMMVFISHFSAVGSLARTKLPSMTHEGGLWLSDLTIPDPYYGLPLLAALATLAAMNSSQMADSMKGMGPQGETLRRMSYIFAFALVPAGHFAPSAIALLWGCNALLQAAQSLAFGNAGIRRIIGLPPAKAADGKSAPASFAEVAIKKWAAATDPKKAAEAAKAATASKAVGAPPPGSRPAVNYLASKPRVRTRRKK